jgi:5-methylcytosine-specific restriction endonuclease McrA
MEEIFEFINRCHGRKFQKIVNQCHEESKENAREKSRLYHSTEKGKQAAKRGWTKRQELIKQLRRSLTDEERDDVDNFYANRPEGYTIDHIIPISRGGKHHVSNLHYLKAEQNGRKHTKSLKEIRKHFLLFRDFTITNFIRNRQVKMNVVVELTYPSHEHFYPISDDAKSLCAILGKPYLTKIHLRECHNAGWEIKITAPIYII